MTTIRTFLIVLLIANLFFFLAAGRGIFGGLPAGEPGRLEAQIDPQKIRIVAPGEAEKPAEPKPEQATPAATPPATETPVRESAPAGAAPAVVAAAAEPKAPPASQADAPAAAQVERCTAVAGLTGEQVAALQAKVQGDQAVKLEDRVQESSSWWVNIPPAADRDAAIKRAEEVRTQGVGGAFVIREDGEHRNAVSLGLFKSEVAAQEFMRQMQTKGVKGARITVRSVPGTRHTLDLRGPADRVAELAELALAANTAAKRQECATR